MKRLVLNSSLKSLRDKASPPSRPEAPAAMSATQAERIIEGLGRIEALLTRLVAGGFGR